MYLEDSDTDEVVVYFKKESKVRFDESLNEVYYISAEEYLLEPPRTPPNKWFETFLQMYF